MDYGDVPTAGTGMVLYHNTVHSTGTAKLPATSAEELVARLGVTASSARSPPSRLPRLPTRRVGWASVWPRPGSGNWS